MEFSSTLGGRIQKIVLKINTWLEEILVWYSGWKQYLLEENLDLVDKNKIEEAFYLMMLLIDQKVSKV